MNEDRVAFYESLWRGITTRDDYFREASQTIISRARELNEQRECDQGLIRSTFPACKD